MASLIIIAYDTEATAEAARKKLFELQKEYLIELGDAVVAVRQPDGQVKLNQLVNMTAAGAVSGGMWAIRCLVQRSAQEPAPLVAGTRMSASMTTS
jgi:uncharacterized membrane protein